MAYVLAVMLIGIGVALILGRNWASRDMAKGGWYSFNRT
jgi:hypothetical protein